MLTTPEAMQRIRTLSKKYGWQVPVDSYSAEDQAVIAECRAAIRANIETDRV